eukprot:Sspe_Gene.71966::Locus_42782_Transcript_1_1_Confidence_1.000_Length_878::g.71966::m.71966
MSSKLDYAALGIDTDAPSSSHTSSNHNSPTHLQRHRPSLEPVQGVQLDRLQSLDSNNDAVRDVCGSKKRHSIEPIEIKGRREEEEASTDDPKQTPFPFGGLPSANRPKQVLTPLPDSLFNRGGGKLSALRGSFNHPTRTLSDTAGQQQTMPPQPPQQPSPTDTPSHKKHSGDETRERLLERNERRRDKVEKLVSIPNPPALPQPAKHSPRHERGLARVGQCHG